jgi:hypothetical protein
MLIITPEKPLKKDEQKNHWLSINQSSVHLDDLSECRDQGLGQPEAENELWPGHQ